MSWNTNYNMGLSGHTSTDFRKDQKEKRVQETRNRLDAAMAKSRQALAAWSAVYVPQGEAAAASLRKEYEAAMAGQEAALEEHLKAIRA